MINYLILLIFLNIASFESNALPVEATATVTPTCSILSRDPLILHWEAAEHFIQAALGAKLGDPKDLKRAAMLLKNAVARMGTDTPVSSPGLSHIQRYAESWLRSLLKNAGVDSGTLWEAAQAFHLLARNNRAADISQYMLDNQRAQTAIFSELEPWGNGNPFSTQELGLITEAFERAHASAFEKASETPASILPYYVGIAVVSSLTPEKAQSLLLISIIYAIDMEVHTHPSTIQTALKIFDKALRLPQADANIILEIINAIDRILSAQSILLGIKKGALADETYHLLAGFYHSQNVLIVQNPDLERALVATMMKAHNLPGARQFPRQIDVRR